MIVAINDQPVESVTRFSILVSSLPPKQKVTLLAVDHRTGNSGTIMVTTR
jgi:hypothetical protein